MENRLTDEPVIARQDPVPKARLQLARNFSGYAASSLISPEGTVEIGSSPGNWKQTKQRFSSLNGDWSEEQIAREATQILQQAHGVELVASTMSSSLPPSKTRLGPALSIRTRAKEAGPFVAGTT